MTRVRLASPTQEGTFGSAVGLHARHKVAIHTFFSGGDAGMRGIDARRTVRNGAYLALCLVLSGAGGIAAATMPSTSSAPEPGAPDEGPARTYSLAEKVSTVADLPPLSSGLTHSPASRTV